MTMPRAVETGWSGVEMGLLPTNQTLVSSGF